MTDTALSRQLATYICWHLIGHDYLPHTLTDRRLSCDISFCLQA